MDHEVLFIVGLLVLMSLASFGYGFRPPPYSLKPILTKDPKPTSHSEPFIPKVVYQTNKTKELIPALHDLRKRNLETSPSWLFEIWDDAEVDEFIKTTFPSRVYEAFSRINPKYGAAKADFWRYCVLYARGGVYVDLKTEILADLSSVIRPNDEAILDVPRKLEGWRDGTYEQWFLAYSAGHPYLREMIEQITDDILSGKIPECRKEWVPVTSCSKQRILELTGPDAYTRAIERAIAKHGIMHRTVPIDSFLSYGNNQAKLLQYARTGTKHYSEVDEGLYVW